MTYCISDIHGKYGRYLEMLDKINFSDEDKLYILGDVIDRNPFGIEILKDIMARPNVIMIRGNHEQMMLDAFAPVNDFDAKRLWRYNGGGYTHRRMLYGMSVEERMEILQFVQELPDHLEIEVNGQKFHLVHGMPGDTLHDRLWGRPEPPIPRVTVIVGHTCTYWLDLDEDRPFEIWYGPGLIDIDCGCGNNTDMRRLACLRLDDMKEFYV